MARSKRKPQSKAEELTPEAIEALRVLAEENTEREKELLRKAVKNSTKGSTKTHIESDEDEQRKRIQLP